ncbi:SDR family oxidoreductase [Nocardia seriolae]|uniref:SDR family oxidoreductase n=1 Tax=Nocardia seriolae TaxID=37332 RepID=UPI0008FF7020|nr:SDR family oxidoreductase [Nocardia seriolae]OJF83726.1 short-chain dehydrogenase [Nocardia seriolae]PSK30911.1 KR domain-containing protein [Nocardia seriolae]QOW32530.1 SDR family oxidoreductase [Nocardia seriolae]QUN20138.1 SDR family oxidoreductase [Nocardia seriolae]WNJ59628.1 SDR family oxidoreductase [Nocardia seriolae]
MARFAPHPDRRPAIVAGASSGIGTATAEALAALGHPVALGARRVEICETLAEKIRAAGGEAFAGALDVRDTGSVDEFVSAAERALGPTEVLVSGAGDLEFGKGWEMDPDLFESQVRVHLVGAQRLAHRVLPGMISRRRGDFVIIGSDCAVRARPGGGAYNAAKSGVEAFATQLRMELEGTGVRSSIVRPGQTLTGMGMQATPEVVGPLLQNWAKWGFARHAHFLRPADLAAAVTAVVATPRGSHLVLVEVQPEAPLSEGP